MCKEIKWVSVAAEFDMIILPDLVCDCGMGEKTTVWMGWPKNEQVRKRIRLTESV